MYSEACEAQGMTLADLLHKRILPRWTQTEPVTISSISQLYIGVGEAGKQAVVTFYNDAYDDLTVKFDRGEYASTETIKARSSLTVGAGEGWHYYFGSGRDVYFVLEGGYYASFGFDKVVIDATKYPQVVSHWDNIVTRANEKYWKRYLAAETLEEWQIDLQVLTDAIVPRYERAFRQYAAFASEIDNKITSEMTTTYLDVKDSSTGSSKGKVSDTPDQDINENDTFAGTTSKSSTENTNTKSGSVKVAQSGADGILGHVNNNINMWRDLETELVNEYASAFMSFIWC